MLNLPFSGHNYVKIYISTLANTYNIPDNPLRRYEIYLWHKELFTFNFWQLSEDCLQT